jgi:soluble lytic murein transglycosylase-like protein
LKAQVWAESGFNPDALSRVGASGLAQFMKRTWAEWRDGTHGIQDAPPVDLVLLDPRDPEDAIRAQAAMMAWLLKAWKGDVERALASYNWGYGNVSRVGAAPSWRNRLPGETAAYITRIMQRLREYRAAPEVNAT